MQVLGKGFGESISKGLNHDVVVFIAIRQVLLAELILLEASRACKGSHVILNARLSRRDKISLRYEILLVKIELLAEHCELAKWLSRVLRVHDFDIIVVNSVARVEADDSSRLDKILIYESAKHDLSIIIKLLGLSTASFIIKDFRVCSIWVLATNLPRCEEWIPIDVG